MKRFSSITRASSRQTWRNKRVRLTLIVGIVLVALLLIVPRAFAVVSSVVMGPVVAVEHWLFDSQNTVPAYFRNRDELLKDQQALERALTEQQASVVEERRLEVENAELRSHLMATATPRIAASVLLRPTSLPYDAVLIDRGSNDGIIKQAPVYTGNNHAIGFVGEVFAESAVVVLVTTPWIESTVYIFGPNIYTTALGIGGGVLRVHVPQGIDLETGNVVVSPSFDGGVYGDVARVESVPTRPEQYGYVSLEESLSELRFVSVGTRAIPELDFESAKAIVERERSDLLIVPVPEGVLVDTISTTTATSTSDRASTTATTTIETPETP